MVYRSPAASDRRPFAGLVILGKRHLFISSYMPCCKVGREWHFADLNRVTPCLFSDVSKFDLNRDKFVTAYRGLLLEGDWCREQHRGRSAGDSVMVWWREEVDEGPQSIAFKSA